MVPFSPYHEVLPVGSKVHARRLPAYRSHASAWGTHVRSSASRLVVTFSPTLEDLMPTSMKMVVRKNGACVKGTERRISLSATFISGYIKKDSSLGRRDGLPGETNRDRHG